MGIIIEGPDNSGKSTFAESLSKRLCMPVIHAGGAPVTDKAAFKMCRLQYHLAKDSNVILDRVTPISHQIYQNRFGHPELEDYRALMALDERTVIVYCRPPNETLMDMSTHVAKDHDSEEHLAMVMDNHHNIIESYDRMMAITPHITYDWTSMDFESMAVELFTIMTVPWYRKEILCAFELLNKEG